MVGKRVEIETDFYKSLPYASAAKLSGEVLYTAGITARDDEGKLVGPGNMPAQFDQIFRRLAQIAEAGGTSLDHMAKVTIYVTDIDRAYADPNQWRKHFTGRPASTLVEVSSLKSSDVLVEIEAIFDVPAKSDP